MSITQSPITRCRLVIALALLFACGTAVQADLSSLVAHYAFDNNYLDSSGNNRHGTLVGSTAYVSFGNDRLGNPNSALWFAGTGGTNSEYIDTGIINYSNATGSLTLTAWLWANSGTTNERLIASKTGGSGNRDWNLSLETQGGVNHTVRFRVSGTGSDLSGGYTTTSLPLDQWVHVAAVYQAGAGAQMKIYLNGIEQTFYNATSIPQSRSNNTETIRIGHRAGLNPQQWWAGRIDDFRIYSAALSQAEIETIISGAVPVPPGEVSNPSPSDGAVGVSRLAHLSWTAGSDATSHDVYFGQTNPPALIGNQGGTTYIPDHPLYAHTTYYWQVDAVNSQGTEPGPVWSFTTSTTTARAVWSMDDNAASADVIDSAGGNHGTFYAGATPRNTSLQHSSDRVEGTGSLSFDGVNQYIAVPRNAVLEQGNAPTREMTAMAWIKDQSGGAAGWSTVIGTGDGGWLLARNGDSGNVMTAGFWFISPTALIIVDSPASISDGQWHHVAVVYDGSSVVLYVDGVGTSAAATGTIDNMSNKGVLIGENAGATGRYWNGLIDDMRIYDYAMSGAEIYHLLNPAYAWNPFPVHNAQGQPTNITLSWSPGDGAIAHDVYFGASQSAVANAQRMVGDINGDRFVNIDDLAIQANQWLTNPGAVVHSADIILSGKVDFADFAELAADWQATPDAAFMGNQAGTTFDPSPLDEDATYYWRVDQVNPTDPDSPYSGRIWSFTTPSNTVIGPSSGMMWETLEWSMQNPGWSGNPYDLPATVTFTHPNTGKTHITDMFYDGGNTWKFRFTGTQLGNWTFTSSSSAAALNGLAGAITVTSNTNPNARGFLTHQGNKFAIQVGNNGALKGYRFNAYMNQQAFVAYPHNLTNTATINAYVDDAEQYHLDTIFVNVCNGWFKYGTLRWDEHSSENPDLQTFAVLEHIIKTAWQRGARLHIWAWGDEERKWTPIGVGGINGTADRRLQRYIAARLGPLPGWSLGYGFDLEEWVTESQVGSWAQYIQDRLGWPQMLWARGRFHSALSAKAYSGKSDGSQPYSYDDAVNKLNSDLNRPHLYEERFTYMREGVYTMEVTRRSLWRYTMAGGIGAFWGFYSVGMAQSPPAPYPNPEQFVAYNRFWKDRFLLDLARANSLTNGYCLKNAANNNYVFYQENTSSIQMTLSGMAASQPAVAVNTVNEQTISLGVLAPGSHTWTAPYISDWAVAVGNFE